MNPALLSHIPHRVPDQSREIWNTVTTAGRGPWSAARVPVTAPWLLARSPHPPRLRRRVLQRESAAPSDFRLRMTRNNWRPRQLSCDRLQWSRFGPFPVPSILRLRKVRDYNCDTVDPPWSQNQFRTGLGAALPLFATFPRVASRRVNERGAGQSRSKPRVGNDCLKFAKVEPANHAPPR